jgi:adenylate cyclase
VDQLETRDPESESDGLTVGALRQLGISEDVIRRSVERGDPVGAIFDVVLLPTIAERTVTAAEVEAAGGLSVAETVALVEAFGLPAPQASTPLLSPQEAAVLIEVGRLQDVWPPEVRVRAARVMGRHLSRIAQAEAQQFLTQFELELNSPPEERVSSLMAVQSAAARLLPLTAHLLVGVHRRWLEHELGQAAVRHAEASQAGVRLPGAVEVTICFCDLKNFTTYADLAGDAAALDAVEQLTELVMHERCQELRFMKALGDGFMLCYSDVHEAVGATVRVISGMRRQGGPGVHASVHRGVAIARDGDYFGSAVNLAARLVAAAREHELIATRGVAEATANRFRWEPVGELGLRGFSDPVEAFVLHTGADRADGTGLLSAAVHADDRVVASRLDEQLS